MDNGTSEADNVKACLLLQARTSQLVDLVQHIQLASSEEGLQPVKGGANLLVTSKESEVQLLHITTCTHKTYCFDLHCCNCEAKVF